MGQKISGLGVYTSSTLRRLAGSIGDIIDPFNDGRLFRICKNGGVALVRGKLVVTADVIPNHQDQAVGDDAAIGDRVISIDIGNTALTANQYAGGYIDIIDGTGEAEMYRISSHPAAAGSATSVKITLAEEVRLALDDATARYSLKQHPCSGVVIAVTDHLDAPIGVPCKAVAAGADEYFLAQVKGPCLVLADLAWTRGDVLVNSANVAGALQPFTAAMVRPLLGVAEDAAADTEYGQVILDIP